MNADLALDVRLTAEMSAGIRAYRAALIEQLPRAAPELRIARVGRGRHFGLDENLRLPREIARSGAPLVHYLSALVPLRRSVPYLLTVHDTIPLRFPQLVSARSRLYYATVGRAAIRAARLLLVHDPRTGDELARLLGIAPERVRAIPLGYDPQLLASYEREAAPRPYLLYAGNHRPHKNLATLFAAWAALPEELALDCYTTGRDDLAPFRARFGRTHGSIVALGEVDRARLGRLYRGALAYVQPSLLEGFGLPLLEAAVVGTPVVASAESIPAIARGRVLAFPARDVAALAAHLGALVRDPEAARRRAAEVAGALHAYTWERFAASLAAVYREQLSEIRASR
ncbi:MAG: glycosyltransferase [Vulcanimicrobiaceae bacterium]